MYKYITTCTVCIYMYIQQALECLYLKAFLECWRCFQAFIMHPPLVLVPKNSIILVD